MFFSFNILDATKFVFLSVFTLKERFFPRICSKSRLKSAKSPLPVDVRRSKTSLLKTPHFFKRAREENARTRDFSVTPFLTPFTAHPHSSRRPVRNRRSKLLINPGSDGLGFQILPKKIVL